MSLRAIQPSFTGGELAPSLYARTDLAKYAVGLRTCRNFFIHPHGGASSRAGFMFVAEVKDSTRRVRLIPFRFNISQQYVLEFGHLYMRVHKNGGTVVTTSGDPFEIATPYTEDDLSGLSFAGIADTMFISHRSYAPRRLSRTGHAAWAMETVIFAPKTPAPKAVSAVRTGSGGTAETLTYVVTAINAETGEESLASNEVSVAASTSGTWPSGTYITVNWNEVIGLGIASASFNVTSGSAGSTPAKVNFDTGTGGNGTITSIIAGATELLSSSVAAQASTPATLNAAAANINAKSYIHGFTASTTAREGQNQVGTDENGQPIYETVTVGYRLTISSSLIAAIDINGTAVTMSGTIITNDKTQIFADGIFHGVTGVVVDGVNICNPVAFTTAASAAAALASSINGRVSSPDYRATVSGTTVTIHANEAGTVPNGRLVSITTKGTITISSANGALAGGTNTGSTLLAADQYNVYKQENGIYGYIGSSEGTSFKDDNISADASRTPPKQRNPFNGPGDYPSTVDFYEQRLYFGATDNAPQSVWGSVINAYSNFNTSRPARDDEAVTFTIAASQVNEIRHIVPLGDMLLLTSDAEWRVSGGGDGAAITPSSILLKPQSYRGAARVRPIVIGNTILYVQDKGSIVRDLAYKLETDGFTGDDLSVMSNHLFKGYQIVDWAYAQVPHSIVWAVRSDGVLLGLTYMREHEVWAWHRHDTAGAVESVCTVSEGAEDVLYAVISRTVNGTTRRYIERLHERNWRTAQDAFCVDSGLTYSGPPTSTISGLDHLEGETVSILAGGDVLPLQVVSAGTITLPRQYDLVHVGLPYICDLETMNIDMGMTQQGTVQARKKSVPRLVVRVEESREFEAGPSPDRLLKTKINLTHYDEAIALYTGDHELTLQAAWNSHGRVMIRQADPVPLTVLAIMPEVEIGG